jgi:hypothetical protein
MTTQLVLRFDNADDLIRVLELLKINGLERVAFQPRLRRKKQTPPEKRDWTFIGSADLKGALDDVNIRDYAYED